MTATTGAVSKKRRPRRDQPANLTHRVMLRFGDEEMVAVEETRRALSVVRECEVSFAEAVRRLLTDKVGLARIEAQAKVIAAGTSVLRQREIPQNVIELLNDIQQRLGYCQGSLNSLSKELVAVNEKHGTDITQEQLDVAFDDVHTMRQWVSSLENLLVLGNADGNYQ